MKREENQKKQKKSHWVKKEELKQNINFVIIC